MSDYLFPEGLASFLLANLEVGVESLTSNVLIKNQSPDQGVLLFSSTLGFVKLRSVEKSRGPGRINRTAVALRDFVSQIK